VNALSRIYIGNGTLKLRFYKSFCSFRIHNLTAYLQALHKEGLANEDHTILLLNCYTKLKDNQKLDEFIFKDRDSVDFDLEIAIRVCRQAGRPLLIFKLGFFCPGRGANPGSSGFRYFVSALSCVFVHSSPAPRPHPTS